MSKGICSVEGCEAPVKVKSLALCGKHYARMRRRGTLELEHLPQQGRECTVEDCVSDALSRGFCSTHYDRWRRHGDPLADFTRRHVPTPCSVDGCEKLARGRGWCPMHYERWRLTGSTDDQPRLTTEQRFWAKVNKTETCWLWTAGRSEGYGSFGLGAGAVHAHAYSYALHFGPIPEGMEVDHKCRNRACVNPDHLHAVTRFLNAQNLDAASRRGTTGVRGVYFDQRRQRFVAHATAFGRSYWGGSYLTLAEAEAAVIALRNRVMANNLADRGGLAPQQVPGDDA